MAAYSRQHEDLKTELILTAAHPHVVVIGEAGFDRLQGPSRELQRDLFHFQSMLAEEMHKPMVIHCVRGWDDLLSAHREIKPVMPWVIHGFRGRRQLAASLPERGSGSLSEALASRKRYWSRFHMKGSSLRRTIPEDQ